MLHMFEEGPGGPDTFRVAALHMTSCNDERDTPEQAERVLEENFRRTARLVRLAASAGAKVIVTPEYGNTGRRIWPSCRALVATRIPQAPTDAPLWEIEEPGIAPYLRDYARLSREVDAFLLTHVLERAERDGETVYYNSFVAFDPGGRLVANYRKINRWAYEYVIESSGDEVVAFDTPYGRFGMLTCLDCLVPWTWGKLMSEYDIDFIATNTLWQHVPLTGHMAMKMLAVLSNRTVIWSNQARGGLGGGAGIVRSWSGDTTIGIWGAEGVVVANLPLPDRLRSDATRADPLVAAVSR